MSEDNKPKPAPAAAAPASKPAAPTSPPPPAVPGKVTFTIDGQTVSVNPGSTIIQGANQINKYIPHFCYHPGLPVVGQCRMCFVEIEGMPKLATACSQPAGEGMKVQTESAKVKAGQNSTLEFTLLNHPLDCPICDRGGECKLQDYTYEYGPPLSRMHDDKVLRDKHKAVSEEVVLDQERCILCTRCVRFSADVDGRGELVVNERGNAAHIDVFEERPMQSNFSGNVVDLCPVGALTAKDFRFAARPWELKTHQGVCTGCAVGCNIELHTKHRHPGIVRPDHQPPVPQLLRLMPRENMDVNTWWMCDKGRWGYHFHNEEAKRLHTPQWRRTPNPEAQDVSLREIQAYIDTTGAQKWEFWIDDALPHEGIAWAKELANSWTGRGRPVGAMNDSAFAQEFLKFWSGRMSSPWTAGTPDWSVIKTVVAPYTIRELEDVAPILALRLGQAARKGNLKWEKKSVAELGSVAAADDVAYLAPVPQTSADIAALQKIPANAKLLILWTQANSRGLLNEGIVPVEAQARQLSGAPKGPVFFFGQRTQNPLSKELIAYLSKAPLLVVADSFTTELTEKAHVILPLTPLYESTATLTNLENRRQVAPGIRLHNPNAPTVDRGGAVVSASLRLL
ncbi:MAG: (2Fe-2S)-binding protein [Bdellovibrionales bacterium]|nr:(2Fe-2S)-binding protein [Bdellovibrionales bacterium]